LIDLAEKFGQELATLVLQYRVTCQARLIEKCARQNTPMVLCVNRIPPEQKKQFPEVLCVFRMLPEQKPASLLSGKFPSLQNSEYRRSNSLQKHPPPTSIRIPQEGPHFVELSAGATSPLLLGSLTTTLEQTALREILLLEEIQG
jgi:hypothetical protein